VDRAEVGERRALAREKPTSVREQIVQHRVEAAQLIERRRAQRRNLRDIERRPHERTAVGRELQGRHASSERGAHVVRIREAHDAGRQEDARLHPLAHERAEAPAARREQRRLRRMLLQEPRNPARVAVDVSAHLQHRRASVTAGQRHQLRPRLGLVNVDRVPLQLLEAENDADLLRVRRAGIMVQDDA
jgi:hypothetical protein